jgi:hypothetical protein
MNCPAWDYSIHPTLSRATAGTISKPELAVQNENAEASKALHIPSCWVCSRRGCLSSSCTRSAGMMLGFRRFRHELRRTARYAKSPFLWCWYLTNVWPSSKRLAVLASPGEYPLQSLQHAIGIGRLAQPGKSSRRYDGARRRPCPSLHPPPVSMGQFSREMRF